MIPRVHATMLLVATVSVVGCGEVGLSTAPGSDPMVDTPSGSVLPVIQQLPGLTPGTVRYLVRVVARDVALVAYQGRITFAPDAFEIVDIVMPTGQPGELRVINRAEARAGTMRFAGVAPERFGDDAAFTLIVRSLAAGRNMALRVVLDVAGDGQHGGAALPMSRLLLSTGVRDTVGRPVGTP